MRAALAVTVAGALLYAGEVYVLALFWGAEVYRHDFLVGSIPFGLGLTLLAIRSGSSALDRLVAPLGKYTLLIYLSHIAFVDLFRVGRHFIAPDIWRFVMPFAVLAASTVCAVLVSRAPLRRLVESR